MKFNFKLSGIEVSGIKIGGIEINTEMSMSEMIGIRKETECMLEQMPTYLEQLAEGAKKFMELDSEFSGHATETYEELVARKTAERRNFFANLNEQLSKKSNKEVE